MTEDRIPPIVIGDRIVTWVLGVSAVATLGFLGWIATSMIEVRSDLGHLGDQMASFREQREAAANGIIDRLVFLSERVRMLEERFDRASRSEEKRR